MTGFNAPAHQATDSKYVQGGLSWSQSPIDRSRYNTPTNAPSSRIFNSTAQTIVTTRAPPHRSPTAPSGHPTLRAPLPALTLQRPLDAKPHIPLLGGDSSTRQNATLTPHAGTNRVAGLTPSALRDYHHPNAHMLTSSRTHHVASKSVAQRTPTAPSGHPSLRLLPLMGLQQPTPMHGATSRFADSSTTPQLTHHQRPQFHLQQQRPTPTATPLARHHHAQQQQAQQQQQPAPTPQHRTVIQVSVQQQQQRSQPSRTPQNASKYQNATQRPVQQQQQQVANEAKRQRASKSTVSATSHYGNKEIIFARLNAKVLIPARVSTHAESQKGALCISPSTKAYKITRVLQAAIYGGVFEAECYSVHDVWHALPGVKPVPMKPRVGLKIMLRDLEAEHRESLQEDITAELQFESAMKGHRNVLSYEELWESKSKGIIYVVMPFAEFEDLFEVLRKRAVGFSEAEARWLFRQLLEGVRHLHSRGIGFRDHSLENVLMFRSSDGRTVVPKITDPGQAVRIEYDNNGKVMELEAKKLFGKSFRPPEVYHEPKRYNPIKVDVFCLGWMLFFAVTKRQPFDRSLDTDPHWPLLRDGKFHDLLKYKGNPRLSPELIGLLQAMMHPDRHQRPDPRECLQHPWFQRPGTVIEERTLRGPPPQPRSRPAPG